MKLSKVSKILNMFEIEPEQLAEYNVDNLDLNRVPNTKETPGRNPEKIQVSLLRRDGTVEPLDAGQQTRHHITSDVLAVHTQFGYTDGTNRKAIYVR